MRPRLTRIVQVGTAKRKASVLSFVMDDLHPHDIGTIVDRSGGRVKFPGYRYVRLFAFAFETFPPHDCPLCSEQVPLSRPGRVRSRML